jgi:hypothetical protein
LVVVQEVVQGRLMHAPALRSSRRFFQIEPDDERNRHRPRFRKVNQTKPAPGYAAIFQLSDNPGTLTAWKVGGRASRIRGSRRFSGSRR